MVRQQHFGGPYRHHHPGKYFHPAYGVSKVFKINNVTLMMEEEWSSETMVPLPQHHTASQSTRPGLYIQNTQLHTVITKV
jgi:hypothetical protein